MKRFTDYLHRRVKLAPPSDDDEVDQDQDGDRDRDEQWRFSRLRCLKATGAKSWQVDVIWDTVPYGRNHNFRMLYQSKLSSTRTLRPECCHMADLRDHLVGVYAPVDFVCVLQVPDAAPSTRPAAKRASALRGQLAWHSVSRQELVLHLEVPRTVEQAEEYRARVAEEVDINGPLKQRVLPANCPLRVSLAFLPNAGSMQQNWQVYMAVLFALKNTASQNTSRAAECNTLKDSWCKQSSKYSERQTLSDWQNIQSREHGFNAGTLRFMAQYALDAYWFRSGGSGVHDITPEDGTNCTTSLYVHTPADVDYQTLAYCADHEQSYSLTPLQRAQLSHVL